MSASFMLSDPIFQGLALAMISGIIVSTALTVGVIPVPIDQTAENDFLYRCH